MQVPGYNGCKGYLRLLVHSFIFVVFPAILAAGDSFDGAEIYVKLAQRQHSGDREGTGLDEGQSLAAVLATLEAYGLQSINKEFQEKGSGLGQIYRVCIAQRDRAAACIRELSLLNEVDFAEPVPIYHPFYTPDDVDGAQWHLPHVRAEAAWDLERGDGSVVIAIVDDAVRTTHEDLRTVLWQNPAEIAGNGLDDDGNGFVDDIVGWDFADADNDPNPPAAAPRHNFGHGTHCAGIAAAASDNGRGIASLAFTARIMALKCRSDAQAERRLPHALQGVEYAIQAGADIIFMPWGSPQFSRTAALLMQRAHADGIILVAAAGNNNSAIAMYPSADQHVISVAATDQLDRKADFSNYGSSIDLTAPGVNIYSAGARDDDSYEVLSGTSMAAAMVSGMCALMLSFDPSLSPDEVELCLKQSSIDIDSGNEAYRGALGAGRLDALSAIACLQRAPEPDFSADPLQICPGGTIQFQDESGGPDIQSWEWRFEGARPSVSRDPAPLVRYDRAGEFAVELTVGNRFGEQTLRREAVVEVSVPKATLRAATYLSIAGIGVGLKVDLSGRPPWSLSYNLGGNRVSVSGILESPFVIEVNPPRSTFISLEAVSDADCKGDASAGADILVIEAADNFVQLAGTAARDIAYGGSPDPFAPGSFAVGLSNQIGAVHHLGAGGDIQRSLRLPTGFRPFDLVPLSDGSLLLAGDTDRNYEHSRDVFAARTDASGRLLWLNTYGTSGREMLVRAVPSLDNSMIIASWTASGGSGDNVLLSRFTADGNRLWTSSLSLFGDDQYYALAEAPGGGAYFCGSSGGGSGGWQMFVGEVDAAGRVGWVREYRAEGRNFAYATSIIRASNGALIVGGYYWQSDIGFMVSIEANGPVRWSSEFAWRNGSFNSSLSEDHEGNLYLGGNGIYADGERQISILQFDGSGRAMRQLDFVDGWIYALDYARPNIYVYGISGDSRGAGDDDAFLARFNPHLSSCLPTNSELAHQAGPAWLDQPFVHSVDTAPSMRETQPDRQTAAGSQLTAFNFCCDSRPIPIVSETRVCPGKRIQLDVGRPDGSALEWWVDGIKHSDGARATLAFEEVGEHRVTLISGKDDCRRAASVLVHVAAEPAVEVSPSQELCKGTELKLFARGGVAYQWSPAEDLSCTDCPEPVLKANASREYTVRIRSEEGCELERRVAISVLENCCNGAAPIRPDFQASKLVVCPDDTLSFSNLTPPGAASFSWTFGDGGDAIPPRSNDRNPRGILFSQPGSYECSLSVLDSCGNSTSTSQTIFVLPAPRAITGNDIVYCTTGSMQVELGESAIANYEYRWDPESGLSDPRSANPIATIDGPARYSLTVTDLLSGCSSTAELDIVGIDFSNLDAGQDSTVCRDSLQLGALANTARGDLQFRWSPPDGLSDPTAARPMAFPNQSTTYHLRISSDEGCSIHDSVRVSVDPCCADEITPPRAAFAASDTVLCDSGDLLITNLSINASTFEWRFGSGPDVNPAEFSGADPGNISYRRAGRYTIELIARNGCGMSSSATMSILVGASPSAYAGRDSSDCMADTIRIQLGADPRPGFEYQWTPALGLSNPRIANPLATVERPRRYTLEVRDPNSGCSSSASIEVNPLGMRLMGAGPDQSVCDEAVRLGSPANERRDGLSFLWHPADGLDDPTAPRPMALPDTKTVYSVTVNGPDGCEITDEVEITRSPCCDNGIEPPRARFEISDSLLCSTANSLIIRNRSEVFSAARFYWTFGAQANLKEFDGPNPPPLHFTTAGRHTLRLEIVDSCGYRDVFERQVLVGETILADAGPDREICREALLIGTEGRAGLRYEWTPADGLDDSLLAQPRARPLRTTVYRLTVTNEAGCRGQDSVVVEVSDSISGRVWLPTEIVAHEVGEVLRLPLYFEIPASHSDLGPRAYTASLRFNASLLHPLEPSAGCSSIENDDCVYTFSGMRPAGLRNGLLATIFLRSALGNAASTPIELNFRWDDADCAGTPTVESGSFYLENQCSGPRRYFLAGGQAVFIRASPNPFFGQTQFHLQVIERGLTRLSLADNLGRPVQTIFEQELEKGLYTIDYNAGRLSSGSYFCILETPTERFYYRVLISR